MKLLDWLYRMNHNYFQWFVSEALHWCIQLKQPKLIRVPLKLWATSQLTNNHLIILISSLEHRPTFNQMYFNLEHRPFSISGINQQGMWFWNVKARDVGLVVHWCGWKETVKLYQNKVVAFYIRLSMEQVCFGVYRLTNSYQYIPNNYS